MKKFKKKAVTMSVCAPLFIAAVSPITIIVIGILAVGAISLGGFIIHNIIKGKKKNVNDETIVAEEEEEPSAAAESAESAATAVESAEIVAEDEVTHSESQVSINETQTAKAEAVSTTDSEIQSIKAEAVSTTDSEIQSIEEANTLAAQGEITQEANTPKLGIVIRYNKSFKAKLIQADDNVKNCYSELKNAIMSYKKVTARLSWACDSINLGRTKLAKFNVRGKTLYMYLALDPMEYEGTKIKVDEAKGKRFESTPCLCKIKNARRLKVAKELIEALAAKAELEAVEPKHKNYYLPYEETQALVDKKLIKELVTKEKIGSYNKMSEQNGESSQKAEFISSKQLDEALATQNVEHIKESVSGAVVEAPAMVVDEVVESIDVDKVNQLIGDVSQFVYTANVKASAKAKKKVEIVNIDTLNKAFNSDDAVTLEALADKGIIAKNTTAVKVLARGTLSKPLEVYAAEFSNDAIKMIIVTGGKVVKIKK